MTKAIVLGSGMVGSVMAADLACDPSFDVAIADVRPENLAKAAARSPRVETVHADLSDPAAIGRLVADYDIVLGALASKLGFAALRAVIEAGKNYCDISFMAQDALELDALAKSRGVTAVVDMGVAPGMSNLLCGHAVRVLDQTQRLAIYVGGLPRERRWPFQYKAGFSPADVIEEYTRPSRIVEHGAVVVREALSEPELLDFPGIGSLEAFNTDGLRSLAYTLKVPFMVEKTLRYPGHIELMRVLRSIGLFSNDPIELPEAQDLAAHRSNARTVKVRPLDLLSKLMFPMWTYQPGEEDLTVMRVEAHGTKNGHSAHLTWDLFDLFDAKTQATSMARTTAFPCTIVARLLASGKLKQPGVNTPELLAGAPGLVDHLFRELEARGVRYQHTAR